MASEIFKKAIDKTPKESLIFAEKSLDILDQVHYLLKENRITQKELAQKLNKSESEISKWLSGLHNMTLKTISKLEAVLGKDILITPLKAKKRFSTVKFVPAKKITNNDKVNIEGHNTDKHFIYAVNAG